MRVVEEPPFEIRETGWGGFLVDIKIFFVPESSAKPETRTHFLQLEPYGDAEMRERQEREGLVKSEVLEACEFNEPTEALWDILTSEDQFIDPSKKKAKGKGKGRAVEETAPGTGTVELPMRGEVSKETERGNLEMIRKAMEEVKKHLSVAEGDLAAKLKEIEDLKKRRDEHNGITGDQGGGEGGVVETSEANGANGEAMDGVETTA